MSQVSPYKERFSLSWLTPVEGPPAPVPAPPSPPAAAGIASPLPPAMEAALGSIGNQVLSKLAVMPGQASTLLNLAAASSMRFEVLLPVVQHLASKGLIERTIEDPSGNDTYQLTQAGTVSQWSWLLSLQPAATSPQAPYGPQTVPVQASPANPLPSGAEAVLELVGNHVLAKLSTVPGQASALLNLAAITSVRFEALLPVVQYLAGKGFLERILEDPAGNDTYRIAPAGLNALAASPQPA